LCYLEILLNCKTLFGNWLGQRRINAPEAEKPPEISPSMVHNELPGQNSNNPVYYEVARHYWLEQIQFAAHCPGTCRLKL